MYNFDTISFLKTESDAHDFMSKIDTLCDTAFTAKTTVEKKSNELFSYEGKKLLLSWCKINNIDLKDPLQTQEALHALKEYMAGLPVIGIQLAFPPTEYVVKSMIDWCSLYLKKRVLLDISVNPTLIAGIILSVNGRYKDYSVKEKLKQYFTTHKVLDVV